MLVSIIIDNENELKKCNCINPIIEIDTIFYLKSTRRKTG